MLARQGLKWRVAGAALAAAFVAAGCGLMEPRADGPMMAPVGTSWTVAIANSGSFGNGNSTGGGKVSGERDWQGRKVRVIERATGGVVLLDAATNAWVTMLDGKGQPTSSFDPPIGWDYPVYVGKKSRFKTQLTIHAAKRTVPLEDVREVEAYEKITVPAGTFDTFRIRSSNNLGTNSVTWWSPENGLFIRRIETRTEKHRQGPGRQETELLSISMPR